MHKTLIVLTATVSLALAGVLVAAPKSTNILRGPTMAGTGIDSFGLTQRTRNLPEQSYPAH
jgi:hypothetical protein